ncbi:Suppressor of fused-like [Exaiptasia diaphana]|nr:Suppressor of fused-like [Exaiptasia diaphana]
METVSLGIEKEGSSLSGVAGKCWWEAYSPNGSFPRPASEDPNLARFSIPQRNKDLATRYQVLPSISKSKTVRGDGYDRESTCASAILITDEFLQRLDKDLDELTRPHDLELPKEYRWPSDGLVITVLPNDK